MKTTRRTFVALFSAALAGFALLGFKSDKELVCFKNGASFRHVKDIPGPDLPHGYPLMIAEVRDGKVAKIGCFEFVTPARR